MRKSMRKIMRKNIKIVILAISLLCICIFTGVYADNSTSTTATDWASLKKAIEDSNQSEIHIQLSSEDSSTWTADSKITIPSGKKVTLVADSSITIKKSDNFSDDSMIENNGSLNMTTSSDEIDIVLDGNKEKVQQGKGPLIAVYNGSLDISNTILKNNIKKSGSGGAIYAHNAELEIENVEMLENEAGGGGGGGISIFGESSNTKLNNVIITDNKAAGNGGGIYAYGELTIDGNDTLISNNTAQAYGGGIMVKTNTTLNAGVISKNTASTQAGGGVRVDGKFTYNGGTIKENTAATKGGGIEFAGGILYGISYGEVDKVFGNTAGDSGNDLSPDLENNVDWTEDENLKLRTINVRLLKSFSKDDDLDSRTTQGMTVTDKYIVFTVWKSNDDNTKIAIADKNTGEILNTVESANFGHANDMAYDSKNDEVYILTSRKQVAKFKISEEHEITDLSYVDCARPYSSIAYNEDADKFLGMNEKKIYVIDRDFKEQSEFEVPTNLMTQGIGYYDGNVYFSCAEYGAPNKYQKIYNNKEKYSNLIYKYNLEGDLIETLYIPNTTLFGEIEACSFDEDGTLVASYNITLNGKQTVSLYKSDIIAPVINVDYSDTQITNQDITVTINSNEEIQQTEDWTLSTDKNSLTKTYSSNDQEDVIVKDLFGNTATAEISIANIDKDKPILDVNYNTTNPTNQDVVVSINSNEEIKSVSGWTFPEDNETLTKTYAENKRTLTKTYTKNESENIDIMDIAGNTSTAVIDIQNIDKEDPEVEVKYSTKDQTSDDVIVTIESNEALQEIEGWQSSDDKRSLTKTYIKNGGETLTIYDLAGNSVTKEIKVANIDKEKPQCNVKYSTTLITNEDVLVTITANEEIQSIDGWTLLEDKRTLTKTYTGNKSEDIEIMDLAGNTSTAVIDIQNIDKEKPVVEVKYSTKELTLDDVIVTIESNEELQEIEGWQLSDDKRSFTKTYTKNDEETLTIYDLAGNSVVEEIKVDNIDKERPEFEVKYSTTLITNEDVLVTITANKDMKSIEGWELSEDKKVLTKKYTENTEEEITVKFILGNIESKTTITVNNIDKIKPEIDIGYSITKLTNEDIIVTITANEEIKQIEGWNSSTDKKVLKKRFTSNTEESITISDLAGNTISDTIKISNIDKVIPKIDVKYSTTLTTDKAVIVTITSDKIIKSIDGWTLSSDKKHLTKTFNENGKEEITITDEAGNSVIINVKVSNIYKTEKTEEAKEPEVKQVDTQVISNNNASTAKVNLPNTGKKSVLIFVAIFVIISTMMHKRLKKYKDVKKKHRK